MFEILRRITVNLFIFFSLLKNLQVTMSNKIRLSSKSTALDVVHAFGEGKYLAGKTAIVTGGNTGIGLETCKALASAGCRVILCTRSLAAGEKAIADEILKPGFGKYALSEEDVKSNIIIKQLDLENLVSVKAFVTDYLSTIVGTQNLDFLVLNAGIMATPSLQFTSAGFEKQIGVNHFGHAYLTKLLTNKLKEQQTPSRVVLLSSNAHTFGEVVVDNLHYKNGRRYTPWGAYGQSKLANLLFAKSFSEQMVASGAPQVTAVSLHPGVIQSGLWKNIPSFVNFFLSFFIFDKTIPQGASTTLYACLAPRVANDDMRGAYLSDCDVKLPSKAALDEKLRQRFWEETQKQLQEAEAKLELVL